MYPLFLLDLNETCIFSRDFWKNNQISNFTKIRQMEAEFSHAERETDRHAEANTRFAQFWRK
jgi:hypothetical protein